MGKHISITFKVDNEECNTVELPALGPDSFYPEEGLLYKSGYLVYKERHLHFDIRISMPLRVAKTLDLATAEE